MDEQEHCYRFQWVQAGEIQRIKRIEKGEQREVETAAEQKAHPEQRLFPACRIGNLVQRQKIGDQGYPCKQAQAGIHDGGGRKYPGGKDPESAGLFYFCGEMSKLIQNHRNFCLSSFSEKRFSGSLYTSCGCFLKHMVHVTYCTIPKGKKLYLFVYTLMEPGIASVDNRRGNCYNVPVVSDRLCGAFPGALKRGTI